MFIIVIGKKETSLFVSASKCSFRSQKIVLKCPLSYVIAIVTGHNRQVVLYSSKVRIYENKENK